MSDLIYQIMWNGAWCDISPNLYKEHPARIRRILYPAATYEAKCNEVAQLEKENAVQTKCIAEQIEELLKNHVNTIDEAAEFCRQYQIEVAQLREKLQIRDNQLASKKAVIEELEKGKDHLQFLLDSVMLEYCPEEMTEEQMENWSKHQKKSNLEIL